MTTGEPWTDRPDDQVDWDRIVGMIDHLPQGDRPGTWRDVDGLSSEQWQDFDTRYGATVYDWMRVCYDEAALVGFDWGDWVESGSGRPYIEDPHTVRDADLHTLRMVLTSHLRGDHFVDGHLLAIAEDGTLRLLLEAIKSRSAELGLARPALSRHLAEIAHCPVAEAASIGETVPCSKIVTSQQDRSDRFQLPTPWIGRLDLAPMLFIGANPSIGFDEDYPDRSWTDWAMYDYFQHAFDSHKDWIKDGTKQLLADGSYSKPVAFWAQIKGRASELLQRDAEPGVDYAITEIVRCRSQGEHGVPEAVTECSARYLAVTLQLSPAPVLVTLGKNAGNALRSIFDLGEGNVIGPVDVGGRQRCVAFLPHPNAFQPRTFAKVIGLAGLEQLRVCLLER